MKSILTFLFIISTITFAQESISTIDKMRLNINEKKFIEKILPSVDDIHKKYSRMYKKASKIIDAKNPTKSEQDWLSFQMSKFDVQNTTELLEALKPFPQSITLAQAAIESGWGRSRFFKEANNIFGVHAFSSDVPRMKAEQKSDGYTIWVRKYSSLDGSIEGYYYFLATKRAFKKFRSLKLETSSPYEISKGLYSYSALGNKYSQMINEIIKNHKFYLADTQ